MILKAFLKPRFYYEERERRYHFRTQLIQLFFRKTTLKTAYTKTESTYHFSSIPKGRQCDYDFTIIVIITINQCCLNVFGIPSHDMYFV